MNGLFQQKQRELVVAVSRVEELSRQLDMLRDGKMDFPHEAGPSSSGELERLYKELQVAFFLLVYSFLLHNPAVQTYTNIWSHFILGGLNYYALTSKNKYVFCVYCVYCIAKHFCFLLLR